jgi:hypothetical protein
VDRIESDKIEQWQAELLDPLPWQRRKPVVSQSLVDEEMALFKRAAGI